MDVNSQLVDMVAQDFRVLLVQRGFTVTRTFCSPESFGNATVTMTSSDFGIRFLKDRGVVVVDVSAPLSDSWHKLEYVLEFVDPDMTAEDYGSPPSVSKLAQRLATNYERVRRLLQSNLHDSGLSQFEKGKNKELMDRILASK